MRISFLTLVWLIALSCTVAFGQQSYEKQIHRLTLPNRNWSLDVTLEDFVVTNEEVKAAVSTYTLSALQSPDTETSPRRMVTAWIRMEPAKPGATATDQRDFVMKDMKKQDTLVKGSLKAFAYNQIPLLRYELDLAGIGIDSLSGNSSAGKGLKAFLVKDDVSIMIGITSGPFRTNDEDLFYSILNSVAITDNTAPHTAFDYYQLGRSLSLQGEYRLSIDPLSRALQLEQRELQLERADRRELIWRLASAYAANGNRLAFIETLKYGFNTDRFYYKFHLAMARLHAADGKLDETIAELQEAFAGHGIEPTVVQIADPLPDPLFDPAFQRFRKDDKFRKAVSVMKKWQLHQ